METSERGKSAEHFKSRKSWKKYCWSNLFFFLQKFFFKINYNFLLFEVRHRRAKASLSAYVLYKYVVEYLSFNPLEEVPAIRYDPAYVIASITSAVARVIIERRIMRAVSLED